MCTEVTSVVCVSALQLPDVWEEVLMAVMRPRPIQPDSRCINTVPDDDNQMISLHPSSRSGEKFLNHDKFSTRTRSKCEI